MKVKFQLKDQKNWDSGGGGVPSTGKKKAVDKLPLTAEAPGPYKTGGPKSSEIEGGLIVLGNERSAACHKKRN